MFFSVLQTFFFRKPFTGFPKAYAGFLQAPTRFLQHTLSSFSAPYTYFIALFYTITFISNFATRLILTVTIS